MVSIVQACQVPGCKTAGERYIESGVYEGKIVCPYHTAMLHAFNRGRKNNRRAH